jgi:hypothetical protein
VKITPLATTCNYAGCRSRITPIGDGSTPFLSTEVGGKYFCSNDCKQKYIKENRQPTAEELLAENLQELGVSDAKRTASILCQALAPKIDEVPSMEQGVQRFRVTAPPIGSLLACVLSADQNLDLHTGDDGFTQTMVRIGDFAGVMSMVEPGSMLGGIAEMKFKKPVPLGEAVLITVEKKGRLGPFTQYLVSSHLEDGTELSRPTIVTMVKKK